MADYRPFKNIGGGEQLITVSPTEILSVRPPRAKRGEVKITQPNSKHSKT